MPNNNDIVRAIGDAIVQAAEYVNRDANDYSKSSIKNARIYGNQIKQNSVPGFVLKDGSIPGLKIVDLDFAKIKNVEIGNAHIANAGIDYAKIKDLHADSAYFGSQIFELGLGDELYIGRLRVNAANIAHLEVGELILESPDGTLYRLGVDEDGNVVTSVYEVQYQNIADMTKNLMSQYTIYRGTTAPETPYVGQLWVNTDTDIIKRCIAVTPEVIWEPVKASELHTSFINAVEKGLEILSTGVIDVKNGGNINIQSGGSLNVKASGNVVVESGGQIQLHSSDAITIGGSPLSVGGTNLLTDTANWVTGWTKNISAPSYAYVTTAVEYGQPIGCLKIAANMTGGTLAYKEQVYYCQPNTTYTLSCGWLTSTSTFIFFREHDGTQYLSQKNLTSAAKSATLTTSANAQYLQIVVGVNPGEYAYIKDIKLEKGTVATDWSPSPQDTVDALDALNGLVGGIQTQVDGKIETYFGTDDPSTSWTSTQKLASVGDMWFNSTSGSAKLKRWNGSTWDNINDQTAIDAYENASTAQDTADGKRRVFVVTPTPPYDIGDLWTEGSTGDLKRCITPKISGELYNSGDWDLATKYTDDAALTNFVNNTYTPTINTKNRIWYQPEVPTSSAINDIWYDTDADPVKIYRANAIGVSSIVTSGNGWYDITSIALDQALKGLNSLGNGSYHFFQSSTRPKSAGESGGSQINIGDIWLYTGTSGTKYVNGATYRAVSTNPTTDSGWLAFVAGAVLTPHIALNANHLTLSGESDLTIANPLGGNAIVMDNTGLTLSSTGQLKLQSADSIIIGGSPLSVGGANLIQNSNFGAQTIGAAIAYESWGGNVVTGHYNADVPQNLTGLSEYRYVSTQGTGGSYRDLGSFTLVDGETYTLSYWLRGDAQTHNGYLVCLNRISDNYYLLNTDSEAVTTTWARHTRTFTVQSGEGGVYTVRTIQYIIGTVFFGFYKLEKGTVATDWSPSPQDTVDALDALDGRLGDVETRVQVFYQTSKPTYTAVGDLWYDTDSNPLEVWKCTNVSTQAHTAFTDPVLTRALTAAQGAADAAAAAQGTANSKINTFVGSSTPTALAAGDLWMDTGNKNIWKRATAAGTGGWVQYLTAAGYLITTGITIDGTDLTVKATGNLNLAADGNLNIQNGGNLNVLNGGDIEINNGGDINVASGGKINVSATDLMISGKTVETYASDKIRLEVQVGGRNLLLNSSKFRDTANWGAWSPSAGHYVDVMNQTDYNGQIRPMLYMYLPGGNGTLFQHGASPLSTLKAGDEITVSVLSLWEQPAGFAATIKQPSEQTAAYVPLSKKKTVITGGGVWWCWYEGTATVTATLSNLGVEFYPCLNGTSLDELKIEVGNKGTSWSPAPEDPASGVKTSKIEIGSDFIDIDAGGTLTLNAVNDIKIGSGGGTLASTIDLSANNSIKLAVSGGTNFYSKSTAYTTYADAGTLQVNGRDQAGYENGFYVTGPNGSTYNYLRLLGVITENGYWTVSFDVRGTQGVAVPITVDICDLGETTYYTNATNTYERKSLTVNVTNFSEIYNFVDIGNFTWAYYLIRNIKIEKGTMATDWSPSPTDPASGVKTSYIDIATDHIDISTGGNLSLTGGNFNLTGGTGTTAIGMSTNRADEYMIWAGNATPASAPFSVKRDGSVKATKIQQEYSNSFWDMADADVPAEFPIYIPAGYTIDSVAFTFQTKKARTFAKASANGGGETVTSVANGSGNTGAKAEFSTGSSDAFDSGTSSPGTSSTGTHAHTITNHRHSYTMGASDTGYTQPSSVNAGDHSHTVNSHKHSIGAHTHQIEAHYHSLNNHTHDVTVSAHSHGINYGINEKSTLATSCTLKVGATTIGTYSPNPSNPVEIRTYMSAGWNTVTVAPDDDARIVAYVLVKLTPA